METADGQVIDVEPGTGVFGSDGEKLGSIMEVGPDYLVVEKGLLFPTDYFVPNGAVAEVTPGRLTLNVTRDEALTSGWDRDPTARAAEPSGAVEGSGRPTEPNDVDGDGLPEASLGAPGMASMLGTTVPAADFATLGAAPVDRNTAYTGDDDPHPDQATEPGGDDLPADGFPAEVRPAGER